MFRLRSLWPLLAAGCVSATVREDYNRLRTEVFQSADADEAPPPAALNAASSPDSTLTQPLDLATLIREALARNPSLREARSRTRAAVEEVDRAGRLEDPVFKFETENVPLGHPGTLNRAEDNMLGLSQTFPFPGKLSLRAEAALRAAEASQKRALAAEREVIAQVKRGYYEYFMLNRELAIHRQHVRILEDFEKAAAAKYRAGTARQQDVIRAQVELVQLHNDIFAIEQRLGSARAVLNTLLSRPSAAPLGEPSEPPLSRRSYEIDELRDQALSARPELGAASAQHRSALAALESARRDALLPDFMVGLDYWHVPGAEDGYGGFLSFNLPWLTGRRAAEKRKMSHEARAAELAIEGTRNQVLFEVQDAFLRVDAARRSVDLVAGELLPKSRQNVEVSRSSYEKDTASFLELLDAERSQRDVELTYYQAAAAYESALADLERAVGAALPEEP